MHLATRSATKFFSMQKSSEAVRDELDAMQETAALLGLSAEPVQPPARVKANIMAAIRNTPQLPPVQTEAEKPADPVAEIPPAEPAAENAELESTSQFHEPTATAPAAGKTNQRMFALAAGVLLIASGVLTGVVVNQNAQQERLEQQLSALNDQRAELTKILTATDVKSKTQRMDDGARVTLAYSAAEGMMAVTTEGLPVLPSDKGYELWLISDTGAVSAGMVDWNEDRRNGHGFRPDGGCHALRHHRGTGIRVPGPNDRSDHGPSPLISNTETAATNQSGGGSVPNTK